MGAASYHTPILIPKYGQTDNVKPLTANRGLPFALRWPNLQTSWTKILLVVNVGSLEKKSNQLKEQKTRSPKTTYCKADQNNVYCLFQTVSRLAI